MFKKIKKSIENWYLRFFKVIEKDKVEELNLIHVENIYGDAINHLNCRSIWRDSKNRYYRANFLKYDNE